MAQTHEQRMRQYDPDYGKRVDLNRASREELRAVMGIGDGLAGQIVDYRERNGRFRSVEELRNLPAIADNEFERLRDRLMVE